MKPIRAVAVLPTLFTLGNLLSDALDARGGVISPGELTLAERAGRRLSTAMVARWTP